MINSEQILKTIKNLKENTLFKKPERIYYSGPNYSEIAIYFGNKKDYKDIIDFWLSILSWVNMDLIDFNNLYFYNEINEYPIKLNYCKKIAIDNPEVKLIISNLKNIDKFNNGLILQNCYVMSNEWNDKKYLFDFGDCFFIYNWYTGE